MSKTYVQADVILPMEYTEIKGNLFIAIKQDGLSPCTDQCHAKGFFGNKICTGYCFRWKNGDDIVFKRANEPTTDYVVVETAYGRTCREGKEITKLKTH